MTHIAVSIGTCAVPGRRARRRYVATACGERVSPLDGATVPTRRGATCPRCLATSAGDGFPDDPPDQAITAPDGRRPARYYVPDPWWR